MSLIFLALLFGSNVSAKMSGSKKFLLGAGSLLTAGYTICKMAKYWPYFETQANFDAKTSSLIAKIETKYGAYFNLLDGYNYQTGLVQSQIDHDVAKDIFTKNDIVLYVEEFSALQAELDLRLSRMSSWCNTNYLYEKWNDKLTDASVNMYGLQLWLEQAQIPLRAKMLAINYKYLIELNHLQDTDAIIKMVFMRSYTGVGSRYPFLAYVQMLDADIAELQNLATSFAGHSELSNQASLAHFNNQVAALFANLEFIRKVVTLDQRYFNQKKAYEQQFFARMDSTLASHKVSTDVSNSSQPDCHS